MKNMNKLIGNHGEDIAANYYLNNGYTTLDRNFLIKKGELDLIVKKDDVIVFVLSLIHISEPTRHMHVSRMPSSA